MFTLFVEEDQNQKFADYTTKEIKQEVKQFVLRALKCHNRVQY